MTEARDQSQVAWTALLLALVLLSGAVWAFHWDLILRDPALADAGLMSRPLRDALAARWPFSRLLVVALGILSATWISMTLGFRFVSRNTASILQAANRSSRLALVLLVYGLFDAAWLGARLLQQPAWQAALLGILPFLHQLVPAVLSAAVLYAFDLPRLLRSPRAALLTVTLATLTYGLVFSCLSIAQYAALMVPHGDTAMYEEHLWNLLNGKGFRSQLDGGRLFLGEHIEFIHVFLIPIYVLYPSLPTLNVIYSFALGFSAVALYGLSRRLGVSPAPACLLALAFLLYPPLQYLNLEASLKTFRPENLAVPITLAALWALAAGRTRWFLTLLLLGLTAKEDYAILYAALGLYFAVSGEGFRRRRLPALLLSAAMAAYLWFAVAVAIPWFRGGPPHYMGYYPSLGRTPAEVLRTITEDPGVLLRLMLTPENAGLVASLILPLAALPLGGSPGRLAVALPSALPLLLGELPGLKSVFFHFHAPLVPVLGWSAAGALRKLERRGMAEAAALLALCCAAWAGFWNGKSPLSVAFYDPGSGLAGYWRQLYVPGERVERFFRFYHTIPLDASVAATDYVRPRFTHHRECHELGARGLKPHVRPEQVDYLVVDLRGPYSDPVAGLRTAKAVPRPGGWETVYQDAYFLVLRARQASDPDR